MACRDLLTKLNGMVSQCSISLPRAFAKLKTSSVALECAPCASLPSKMTALAMTEPILLLFPLLQRNPWPQKLTTVLVLLPANTFSVL